MARLKTATPVRPGPNRGKRPLLAWAAAGAAIAVAAFGALIAVERTDRPSDNGPARPVRSAQQSAAPQVSRPADPPVPPPALAAAGNPASQKIDDRPVAPPDPVPRGPVYLDPPFLIVDGITFKAGFDTYRLMDLRGPPATAACRGDDGHLWACGLRARAALNNAIQHDRLTCMPARLASDGAVEATCTVDGRDLGGRLVKQGWARPVGETYAAETEAAEHDRRGLWNGGWAFDSPG
jgi:endonuclease YncB( thermonuclease family)